MRLYSIADIADIVGLSPHTIRRYIIDGKLAAFKIGGSGHYRIHEKEVYRFFEIVNDENTKTIPFEESKRRLMSAIKNGELKKYPKSA